MSIDIYKNNLFVFSDDALKHSLKEYYNCFQKDWCFYYSNVKSNVFLGLSPTPKDILIDLVTEQHTDDTPYKYNWYVFLDLTMNQQIMLFKKDLKGLNKC